MPSPHTARHTPPTAQMKPGSTSQLALQPSVPWVLPSSHVSGPLTSPSPHSTSETQGPPCAGQVNSASRRQLAVQPSPPSSLPSSHCSPSTFTRPSPQLPTCTHNEPGPSGQS